MRSKFQHLLREVSKSVRRGDQRASLRPWGASDRASEVSGAIHRLESTSPRSIAVVPPRRKALRCGARRIFEGSMVAERMSRYNAGRLTLRPGC